MFSVKQTKLTPGSNLLFSSSFILPEHREALQQNSTDLNKRMRPELDDQEKEEVVRSLAVALFTQVDCTVIVWSQFEDQQFTGKITKLDKYSKRIKIENHDEYSIIDLFDIIRIDLEIPDDF